jgi:type II secretory pathway pseudopilin PulG
MRRRPHRQSSRESGYIFLALMAFLAVMVLMATVAAPKIAHEIRREQEEELVHRGVQYARAIGNFYRKFGRYPANIEQLEDTNHLRFLRRRYKDPITRKDFRLLRYGQVKLGTAIGAPPTVNLPGAPGVALPPSAQTTIGTNAAGTPPANADAGGQPTDQPGTPGDTTAAGTTGDTSTAGSSNPGGLTGQTFGGGAIVGVVSTSKDETIREFGGKNHYDKWLFVYDPSVNRAGTLIMTPQQPALKGATPLQPNQPGTSGTPPAPGNGDLSVQQ